MKKLFMGLVVRLGATICIVSLIGCVASNQEALDTHENTARIDPTVSGNYKTADTQLEEYVNRVGKRMLMVSNRPNNYYTFVVSENNDPILQLDPESHTITISMGILQQLSDEAELAAVLGLVVAKLNHSINIDRETATTMSYAGYDPAALLELQEQYFYGRQDWLRSIYMVPLSPGTIAANKVMVQKMPKGLIRGAEDYQKEING